MNIFGYIDSKVMREKQEKFLKDCGMEKKEQKSR